MTTASGADSLFGILVDGPSDLYSIGHPGINKHQITAPTGPLAAASGAPGNLTGVFLWRFSFGDKTGALTTPSPWSSDTHTGSGLNDIVWSGAFTGDTWVVTVSTAAGTDKYTWTKNGGAPSGEVTMVAGTAQVLSDGVYVTFPVQTGHTLADTWTRGPGVTCASDIGSLTAIPTTADTACDRRVIERAQVVATVIGSPAICGTVYDKGTTNTYDDNVATLDASKTLPSVNQTGGNYGFLFLDPDSFDIDPDFSNLPTNGLKGSAGRPRGVPGPIKIAGTSKGDLKAAFLEPLLLAGAGGTTSSARHAAEPTVISVWGATVARRSPKTLTAFSYDGSVDVAPMLLYGLAVEELDITFSGGKIVDTSVKLTGANYGLSAPATKIAGTGTWTGSFVAMGTRADTLAATDDVYIKCTTGFAPHTAGFKSKVASGSSYSGSEFTITVGGTSHRQTKAGSQYNDSIELADENGLLIGADSGSNREPYVLLATEALTTDLDANDEFQIARTALIPGTGTTPYSGVPPQFVDGPRFTDAHVTLTKDGTTIEATSGSVKLMFPKKPINSLCAGARTLQDLVNDGYFGCQITITRYKNDRTWQAIMETDSRAVIRVALEGERIPINPGVTDSPHREGFYIDIPQFVLTSTKSPKANQSLVVETITGEAEQPDNPSNDLFTLTLNTRQGWNVPA